MNLVDWILFAVVAVSILMGVWRGFAYELLSLLSWVIAFFLAQWFAHDVAKLLPIAQMAETLRHALAFVLLFIGAVFVGGLLAAVLQRLMNAVGLRPADRMLGAIFGGFRAMILLMAMTTVAMMTSLHSSSVWQESSLAPWLGVMMKGVKPLMPDALVQFLP